MSEEILGDRRRALEEEFFARENEALMCKLREREAARERLEALAEATGIRDEETLGRLMAADVAPETVAALRLWPLIEVAWADGSLDPKEREAVLGAAREVVGLDAASPAYALLERWLERGPSTRVLEAWKAYVDGLKQVLADTERLRLRDEWLGAARRVAEAAGGLLGVGPKISRAEEEKLTELERTFA